MFTVNRIVALLTPVFAAGAAAASAWLLKHFPGVPVPSQAQLVAAEITAATGAITAALSWLKGHQAWEKTVADLVPRWVIEQVEAGAKDLKALDPRIVAQIEQVAEDEVQRILAHLPAPAAAAGTSARPVADQPQA